MNVNDFNPSPLRGEGGARAAPAAWEEEGDSRAPKTLSPLPPAQRPGLRHRDLEIPIRQGLQGRHQLRQQPRPLGRHRLGGQIPEEHLDRNPNAPASAATPSKLGKLLPRSRLDTPSSLISARSASPAWVHPRALRRALIFCPTCVRVAIPGE